VEPGADVRGIAEALARLFGGTWMGWPGGGNGPRGNYWAQVERTEERTRVTGVLLLGDQVTGADLRKVPVGAIENAANLGVERAEDATREELGKLPPLQRTEGQTGEEWSQLVAQHYTAWAKIVPHPAAAIAAEWNVNRQTVNSWVREARLRRYLPPPRRRRTPEYEEVMKMPSGPVRRAALDSLRRREVAEVSGEPFRYPQVE
jgi:transposase-like protein